MGYPEASRQAGTMVNGFFLVIGGAMEGENKARVALHDGDIAVDTRFPDRGLNVLPEPWREPGPEVLHSGDLTSERLPPAPESS